MDNSGCVRRLDDSCRNCSVFCGQKLGNAAQRCRPYEAAAPGWERGSLGSYRGAVDLRWDRSVGYWRCPGLAGPARSRRGQWWTAGRVCNSFQFSKRSALRVSITVRRSCAWRAWRRSLLSNLQSRSRSHRRQRAATLLSASVSSSTRNSLHSTSALRARTSLSQRRRTARVTY